MKVMFALAERIGCPVNYYGAELIAAAIPLVTEDNPCWYDEEIERARGARGHDMGEVRHFVVDVPDETIRAAFARTQVDAPVEEVQR